MKIFLKVFSMLFLVVWVSVLAVDFPTKPVTIIVPWSAGGATDVLFRLIAEVFPKYANGQPLVIKNIPGGGAVPGTLEFLKSKPDGYTLFSLATPIITKIHWSEVPFTVDDFEPIANIVYDPSYLLVKADSPFKDLQEFIEAAKANPGTITIGNGGYGGGNHLVAVAFEDAVGAEFVHVPFDGGAPCIAALVGGHIAAAVAAAPEGVPQVKAGQLRVLAVFGENRLAVFPNVPTAKEQGVNFVGGMWRGVAAPKGTRPEIVKALHDIFRACIFDPDFMKKAREQGYQLYYLDSASFKEFVRNQNEYWKNLNTFLMTAIGVVAGIVVGALPGITSSMGVILLLPFTYYMDPRVAMMILGLYCSSMFAGSISAVLLRTPGTPSAAATERFKQLIEERTSGRVLVRLHIAEASEEEANEQCSK